MTTSGFDLFAIGADTDPIHVEHVEDTNVRVEWNSTHLMVISATIDDARLDRIKVVHRVSISWLWWHSLCIDLLPG